MPSQVGLMQQLKELRVIVIAIVVGFKQVIVVLSIIIVIIKEYSIVIVRFKQLEIIFLRMIYSHYSWQQCAFDYSNTILSQRSFGASRCFEMANLAKLNLVQKVVEWELPVYYSQLVYYYYASSYCQINTVKSTIVLLFDQFLTKRDMFQVKQELINWFTGYCYCCCYYLHYLEELLKQLYSKSSRHPQL